MSTADITAKNVDSLSSTCEENIRHMVRRLNKNTLTFINMLPKDDKKYNLLWVYQIIGTYKSKFDNNEINKNEFKHISDWYYFRVVHCILKTKTILHADVKIVFQNIVNSEIVYVRRLLTNRYPCVNAIADKGKKKYDFFMFPNNAKIGQAVNGDITENFEQYLSDDEILTSNMIVNFSPTIFYEDQKPITNWGVIAGCSQCNLDVPNTREWRLMMVTLEQNTIQNGYGKREISMQNKKNKDLLNTWSSFYSEGEVFFFPLYTDVCYLELRSQAVETNNDLYSNFWKFAVKNSYFHHRVFRKRMEKIMETFFCGASSFVPANSLAYCVVTGRGVEKNMYPYSLLEENFCYFDKNEISVHIKYLLARETVSAVESVLNKIAFPKIGWVEFSFSSFFDEPDDLFDWEQMKFICGTADSKSNTTDARNNEDPAYANFQIGEFQMNNHIRVTFRQEMNVFDPLEIKNSTQSVLLVVQCPSRGDTFPGNEIWSGNTTEVRDKGSGPEIAAKTTFIGQLQHPLINPVVLENIYDHTMTPLNPVLEQKIQEYSAANSASSSVLSSSPELKVESLANAAPGIGLSPPVNASANPDANSVPGIETSARENAAVDPAQENASANPALGIGSSLLMDDSANPALGIETSA